MNVSPDANPYTPPDEERFSAALTDAERYNLIYCRNFGERPFPSARVFWADAEKSLRLAPFAAIFAGLFTLGAWSLLDLGTAGLWTSAIVAFVAFMGGSLLRDWSSALTCAQVQDLHTEIVDFEKVHRLLATRRTSPSEEPLAVIPVEEGTSADR